MTRILPTATDKLNSPSHSFLHRVISVDSASPEQSIDVSSAGVVSFYGNILPTTTDGSTLGSTTKMFSDLYLASGAVINFNSGDVTITHNTNTLAFAGAANGFSFSNAIYPVNNDAGALGAFGAGWSDIYLASGAVINFNDGNTTLTHSNQVLTISGGTAMTHTVGAENSYIDSYVDDNSTYLLVRDGGTGGNIGLNAYNGTITAKPSTAGKTGILSFANIATTDKTFTFPNATGTIALTSDITGTNSGTNTGDQEATDFDIKDLTDSTNLRTTWSGKQDALTFGIANTNAVKIDHASVADNDYAKFTANGLEGRSYTEVKQDLSLDNVDNTSDATLIASIKDGGSAEIDAGEFGSGTATDGQVLTADGSGGAAWESIAAGGDVSKVGTPVDNQIAVWTGDGTLEGVNVNYTVVGSENRFSTTGGINFFDDTYTSLTAGNIIGTRKQFYFDNSDSTYQFQKLGNGNAGDWAIFDFQNISTSNKTFTFPDLDGTIALTSDIPDVSLLVPYTGATGDVDLDIHSISVDSVKFKHEMEPDSYFKGVTGSPAQFEFNDGADDSAIFDFTDITDQIYTFPIASGTIALLDSTGLGALTADSIVSDSYVNSMADEAINIGAYALMFSSNAVVSWDTYFSVLNPYGFKTTFDNTAYATTDRTLTLPDADGTIALTSDFITWSVEAADTTLTVNKGAIATQATLETLTLPATSVVGQTIRVVGTDVAGWIITQAADQYIKFGTAATTPGETGSLASTNTYDAVELVCIEADLGWVVVSSVGNLTVA